MPEPSAAGDRGQGALALRDVHAGYGKLEVLRGVSIEVAEGEVVCLLGANGTGKSTLIKSVLGLVACRAGSIEFRGQPIHAWPVHRRVAAGIRYLPQSRPVFGDMSVMENLLLGAHVDQHPSRMKKRMEAAIALFPQLSTLLSRRAGVLSGGERQMVGVARVLMAPAELMLLDEPSAGLSPKYVNLLFAGLGEIRAAGKAMLIAEQNAARALAFADYAYVLDRGEIVNHGRAADLRNDPSFRGSYLTGGRRLEAPPGSKN